MSAALGAPDGRVNRIGTTRQSSEGHLRCPYCEEYGVQRMYVASTRLDSCECPSCGARWDEDHATGAFRGRAARTSVVVPRD